MHGNFIRAIILVIFKLALLAGLVVLGIVLVPDDFMAKIKQNVDVAEGYLQSEASKRIPGLTEEFSRKVEETKSDAGNLYQSAKDKYFAGARDWALGIFGLKSR